LIFRRASNYTKTQPVAPLGPGLEWVLQQLAEPGSKYLGASAIDIVAEVMIRALKLKPDNEIMRQCYRPLGYLSKQFFNKFESAQNSTIQGGGRGEGRRSTFKFIKSNF